jgi:hypothetical protein
MSNESSDFIQTGNQPPSSGTITVSGTPFWTCAGGDWFGGYIKQKNYKPVRIVFVDNWLTKCTFEDGKTITVKCQPMDSFSEEVGVALCIARKIYNDAYNDKKNSMKKVTKEGKKSKKKVSPKDVFVKEINKVAERPERK